MNRRALAKCITTHVERVFLQEILAHGASTTWDMALLLGNGGKYAELFFSVAIDVHDGSYVAAAVAVVGCAPDCDDVLRREVVLYTCQGMKLVE